MKKIDEKEKSDNRIYLRIPTRIKDELQKQADADKRSLSNFIMIIIEKYLMSKN